jgi:hypothetical protein
MLGWVTDADEVYSMARAIVTEHDSEDRPKGQRKLIDESDHAGDS